MDKPGCPFCKNAAVTMERVAGLYRVWCHSCEARGPLAKDERVAAAKWFMRPYDIELAYIDAVDRKAELLIEVDLQGRWCVQLSWGCETATGVGDSLLDAMREAVSIERDPPIREMLERIRRNEGDHD